MKPPRTPEDGLGAVMPEAAKKPLKPEAAPPRTPEGLQPRTPESGRIIKTR